MGGLLGRHIPVPKGHHRCPNPHCKAMISDWAERCPAYECRALNPHFKGKNRFEQNVPVPGGVQIVNYCKCGDDYKPTSTSGVINHDCARCGGKPKPQVFEER